MDKAHVQCIVPPRAPTLEHEGAKPWIGRPCPVLTAYDGLEADPAVFETAVRARRVPGPTPYCRTPVSSMESRASQQLRDTTKLPNEPLKGVIRHIGGRTRPRDHQPPLIEQQTQFAADNPATIRETFAA